MPRITPLATAEAAPPVKATLESVKTKLGMVPNLHATFARSPAALRAYLNFSDAMASGRLSAAQREIVALAVGQANACQYCLSAHTMIGKSVGLTESQIRDARDGHSVDALDNAIATLASQIVQEQGNLADDAIVAARNAGLDDELILEVLANVVLNILTNYTNHIAQTDIDFPPVSV